MKHRFLRCTSGRDLSSVNTSLEVNNDFFFTNATDITSSNIPSAFKDSLGTRPTTSDHQSHTEAKASDVSHNVDMILDVLFIFMSGLAIITALVLVTYSVVILSNRYCCCSIFQDCLDADYVANNETGQDDDNDNEQEGIDGDSIGPSAEAYGPVAFKARLWGLSSTERTKILEQVFVKNTSLYNGEEKYSRTTNCSTFKESSVSSVVTSAIYSASPIPKENSNGAESTKGESTITNEGLEESQFASEKESGTRHDKNPDQEESILCQDPSKIDVDSFVLDEETTCAICLAVYEEGDKVLSGIHCSHKFHYDCIMEWMKKCHDHCPYCREQMLTPRDMRSAATQLLSQKRLEELSWGRKPVAVSYAVDMTDSPLSNVSDAVGHDESISPHIDIQRDTIRSTHENQQTEPASPAFSDQAQLGLVALTPLGDDAASPGTQEAAAAETGQRNLEPIRESLDQRMAAEPVVGEQSSSEKVHMNEDTI